MRKPKIYVTFYLDRGIKIFPQIIKSKLWWKDKFGTPRCELEPNIRIGWLWFNLYISFGDDQYWEQWLWIENYCDGDVEKAKKTWGWVDGITNESTWKDY